MFVEIESDIDHAMTLLSGCESLTTQYKTSFMVIPKTYDEVYTASVLDLNGFKLKDIEGTEGFVKQILYKISTALESIYMHVYQYGLMIPRAISDISTKIDLKAIYSADNIYTLAMMSHYDAAYIVHTINNPAQVKAEVERSIANADKRANNGPRYYILGESLMPTIKEIEKNPNVAKLVNDAVKSAGSVGRLIQKYGRKVKDTSIDTGAYKRIYDRRTKGRIESMDNLKILAEKEKEVLADAQSKLGGKIKLHITPTLTKKMFEILKEQAPLLNMFKTTNEVVDALLKDITQLRLLAQRGSTDRDISESDIASGMALVKVYLRMLDEVIRYADEVDKTYHIAYKVAIEALYKLIIACSKMELKA